MNRPAGATLNATAIVSVPSVHQPRHPPISEFFRYHGFWALGVRLFRAVGFRTKAMIISAVFALPLLGLSVSYFGERATAIEFSAKERVGIEYARAALPVLKLIQRQRMFAALEAAKGAPPPELPALRVELDAAMARLATVEKAVGANLGTGQAYAAFMEASKSLPAASVGVDKVFAAHVGLVQKLLDLMGMATDGSNLTLDPDIDSYYLMDAALFRLPAMLESSAQMRGLGAALLTAGTATPTQLRMMAEHSAMTTVNLAALRAGVGKAITYNNAVEAPLAAGETKDKVTAFLQQVNATVLRAEGLQGDAPAYVKAGTEAVEAMFAMADRALTELDKLVAKRIAGIETVRNRIALLLVVSLALVTYLFMSFRKVLEGGLVEVAFHIDAMRDGNLTTHPRAWGADEAARLMLTVAEMQQSLRSIVKQVRGSSDSIVTASTQIAGGALDLQTRTEQTAASLQETAAAMEEITATVQRNGDTVQEATRLASSNAEAAERGSRIIGDVMQTMQGINVSSQRIGDIIGTIDGIAFQTNILALNAAVEAARAGEQGRGFAVVAAEVRALAQRSAGAAREIKSLITASVEQVAGGVKVARDADAAIQAMLGSTQRVRELLNEVAVGSREQNQGVAQSATAVQQMDTATQQNAALVEQTAAAAQAMQQQAQQLAGGVARFQLPA